MEEALCPACEQRRRRERFRVPIVVSVLANLLLFALLARWFFLSDNGAEGKPARSEIVRIEHLVRATPTPRPKVVHQTVVVRPTAQPHEVARPVVAVHTPVTPQPVVAPHVVHQRVIVARAPLQRELHANAPVPAPATRRLSSSQIAAITNNLAGDIAQDKSGENPLHVNAAASGETSMKHYGYDASQSDATGIGRDGDCSPVKNWTEDGWDYYYLSCYVRASDGTADQESIPWPVRFRPGNDPFAGTGHPGMPVAMPLPGWHLTPGAFVSEGVRQYALEHGVPL